MDTMQELAEAVRDLALREIRRTMSERQVLLADFLGELLLAFDRGDLVASTQRGYEPVARLQAMQAVLTAEATRGVEELNLDVEPD